jgi:hypothetical protein
VSNFTIDSDTGELVEPRERGGSRIAFLPVVPANSPPHEVLLPEADPDSPDGCLHYLVGGDAEIVKAIVDFYAAKGTPVPDGYAEAAKAHADNVAAELEKNPARPARKAKTK